jgi:predicted secreted protein
MRKFLLSMVVIMMLTACSNTVSITDPSKPIEVKAGNEFQIVVEANPTTGYHWEIVGELDGSLQLVSREYNGSQPAAVGSGGVDIWKFKAATPGQVSITLGYYPPSNEPTDPQQTTTFMVIVK